PQSGSGRARRCGTAAPRRRHLRSRDAGGDPEFPEETGPRFRRRPHRPWRSHPGQTEQTRGVAGSVAGRGQPDGLADVTRARAIAGTWLVAVEPSITGFIFSVGKGLGPAQAPSLAFIEDAFHKHFKLILDASKKNPAHPNVKVFDPVTDKTFLPFIR